jgi:glucose-6-phosphate 1-dehydrogenase
VRALAAEGLAHGTRLLIEKPFGRDLASAIALDTELHEVLDESQIFRIDHYLAKETVQNILVFRFGNSVFERVWNRDAIDHIEITVAEKAGIDGRGAFYEEVGALRDVVQNHLLQVLSLLTMEPPASFDAEAVRDETAKLLRAVRPLDPAQMVRGQYVRGRVDGREVPGYREEEGVAPESDIETFVAARVEIANWRWAGVPIFLRTGKRLPSHATEIEIAFTDVPTPFFEATGVDLLQPNTLALCIQPDEEITFSFLAKVPGPEVRVAPVTMKFSYDAAFSAEPAEAYERLISEAIEGDQTLFVRADSVERAWRIVQPALDAPPPLRFYEAGTWGPPEADELIAPLRWHLR